MRMLLIIAGAALAMLSTACTSGGSSAPGTLVGRVALHGGPAPTDGQTHLATHGDLLLYTSEGRTGTPVVRAPLSRSGDFTTTVRPGRYFLATTAARVDGRPASGPSISVRSGRTSRADVDVSIK